MSALLPNIICSALLSITGLIVVKKISGSKEKLISFKAIVLMVLLIFLTIYLHNINYNYLFSIVIFMLTIVTYKEILNISMINATISCGIMHLSIILLDLMAGTILAIFITANQVRDIWYLNIIFNLLFSVILISFFSINKVKQKMLFFIEKVESRKAITIILSIVLAILTLTTILYTITINFTINTTFITNVLLFFVFFILIIILLGERSNFEKLSDEYDSLFKYVSIFEDWIEKEQLTRHEYKNQLAVLRSMTKEKKIKDKIDSVIEDFINIDNDMITQLKSMPNGGLKGLLYYKISIAKKNRINISIDIDENSGNVLSKISEDKQKTLTKLLGIYMDNAIEAATDTKKKNISIEIYKIKEEIKIVISNTYNKEKIISDRIAKGVSTKGKGRGNGLYFASKLMSMNDWIEERQQIIDNYYIQTLIIKKV